MNEHILSAALTFSLLAGGTAAIGSDLLAGQRAAVPQRAPVVTLPTVHVVAHRQLPLAVATLPPVLVVGHRAAAGNLKVALRASEAQRVN